MDDNLAEGREELSIGGSNAEPGLPVDGVRAAIGDNDVEPTSITLSLNKDYIEENRGSQWITVTASLDGTSRRTVDTSVRLRVANGTATAADYWALAGDLVIEAGEREGTADILLDPTDDHIDEDDETLEVWGTTARSRSQSPLQVSREQVTIRDDDTAGVTVTPTELSVVEGQSGSYRVVLDSQPTGEVTITVAGHADTDITLSGDTLTDDALTFTSANWNIAQAVTATAAHDGDSTAPPDVTLTHTVSGGDYEGLKADDVVVSITEDDEPGVTLTPDTLEIDEGASDTYTVALDTKPTADVTVAITGHADTDITLSGDTLTDDTLTFTSENWNTAQTVTVTAGVDDDAVNEEEATLTHTVTGTAEYAGVTADSVTVTIVEKDTSVLSVGDAEGRRGRRERGLHREHQRSERPRGDGRLRNLRRYGDAGPGLHIHHWHPYLRDQLRCESDHLGAGHRRRGGRGRGGDLHADAEATYRGRRCPAARRPWRSPGPSPITTTQR